jgi:hypothetical protein
MTITPRHSLWRRVALALATIALIATHAEDRADAAVYTATDGAELQSRLDLAAASVGVADEIQLGPGVFTRKDGFHYDAGPNAANRIAINGTPGETVLQTGSDFTPKATEVLELHGTGGETSLVYGVKIRAPLSSDTLQHNAGLLLEQATAVNVVVEPAVASGGYLYAGILLIDGGRVRAAKATLPTGDPHHFAILADGSNAYIQDVETEGAIVFDALGSGRVTRARVDARASRFGIACTQCEGLDIDDSVIRVGGEGGGLVADGSTGHPVVVDASHVTLVGSGQGATGAAALGDVGTKGTVLRLDNCVLQGVGVTIMRLAAPTGSAIVNTRNCNYPADMEFASGPGSFDVQAHTTANPDFVHASSGDFRLRWSSPLIDAGRSGWLFAESPFALDHANRIADGDLDGKAIPDLGAYEYQAHKPQVFIQAPASAQAGVPVTLDGSKSRGGDPGEPVKWSWSLPGGGTADTASVTLTLPEGQHEYALTVTDPTGQTATVHGTLTVRPAPAAAPAPATGSSLRPAAVALLSNVRVAAGRGGGGSAPALKLRLGRKAVVTARVQRRSGGRWRPVARRARTLAGGDRRLRLPRATRRGRWRVLVSARAGDAVATARATYRVR